MALTRRESDTQPEFLERWPFDRGVFDWAFRPMSALWHAEESDVKIEEFTEDGELVVRAELPGIDPDRDIDISVAEGRLSIRAERRHEEKVEHRDYRRTEIRYGSFSRVVALPPQAKESDIKASYKDGILEVRAPMEQRPAKASKIPINRS